MDGTLLARTFWLVTQMLVGSAHVSGLFCSARTPMAFMLSARSAPDQKHALEAPWDRWVLLISVVDRLLHDLPLALSNLVKRARMGSLDSYAACGTGSRYAPPRAISTQAIRAILLAIATAAILVVRRCRSLSSQGRRRAVTLSVSDHRQAADDEKPSQVVVSTLRYLPEALLAAAR